DIMQRDSASLTKDIWEQDMTVALRKISGNTILLLTHGCKKMTLAVVPDTTLPRSASVEKDIWERGIVVVPRKISGNTIPFRTPGSRKRILEVLQDLLQ